jgi:hypothetical protein
MNAVNLEELATKLETSVPTLDELFMALAKPGRDPREELPPPIFKKGILKLEDLQAGMELKGTVLNVVDFGAFVDVGLKDSGLVHISQMANKYIKSPYDVVSVNDIVKVWVDDPASGKSYRLNDRIATLLVRPRGLHLSEVHLPVDGEPIPGCLMDFGLYAFHNAHELIARGSGPYFYLPKMESHLEARLWNDVFTHAEATLGVHIPFPATLLNRPSWG